MPADGVSRLRRLRSVQAGLARRQLADALAKEAGWLARLAAAEGAVPREAAAASRDPADPLHAAFAAWLPVAGAEMAAARAGLSGAADQAKAARLRAAAARADLEACEVILDQAAAAARKAVLLREQQAMEEARPCKPGATPQQAGSISLKPR